MIIDPGDGSLGSGLPDNLNFGSHKIQNKLAEKWIATDNGTEAGPVTTGKLTVNDARGSKAGWSVKVAQSTQFTEKGGTGQLTNAALTITTGAATNIGGTLPTGGKINNSLTLVPGAGGEQLIFGAKATTGDGISTLGLSKFELAVPAETARKSVEYQSSLTWTLSDTPAP
ncbi:WxL domain-containing protein [Enterococcus ureasiticus]|uniref:WxL domain-containing protein n=1 Tax=Enterococcus ureasiticus TaxID=903984 RepID=UPI000A01CD0F|nr:WxL domain-containing protein [Enterococcus ureasiticus]